MSVPSYDFNSNIFKKNPFYKRLAKAHVSLSKLDSEVIQWEVSETRGNFKIPSEYIVHFHLKSIIGTNPDDSPRYGYKHTARITLPPKYPIEAPELYMITDLWHPNIKSEGKYKGRICGNTKGFGMSYDLELLVIRIGEILQYKNYHAEHTPPFPEDTKAAKWVMEYAEPNGIVNKVENITVDDTPLVGKLEDHEQEQKRITKEKERQQNVEQEATAQKIVRELSENKNSAPLVKPKFKIKSIKKLEKKKINIRKKN